MSEHASKIANTFTPFLDLIDLKTNNIFEQSQFDY